MSLFQRLFTRQPDPREAYRPAYTAIVARGRAPDWYLAGVPDTMDGRFEIIAAILSHVLLRLEAEPDMAQPSVLLTELFVDDMDSQLRLVGVGDLVVGKQIGKMMSALGGRLTAFREAAGDVAGVRAALVRNLWAGVEPGESADLTAARLANFAAALKPVSAHAILSGDLPAITG